MTLKKRINYWLGRARVARAAGAEREAATATLIAEKLSDMERAIEQTSSRVEDLIADMPVELE
jgi:hypothetical protein